MKPLTGVHGRESEEEIKKYKKDSISKWEEIEKRLLNYPSWKNLDWEFEYWNGCGYCAYYQNCNKCPLSQEVDGTLICHNETERKTYAYLSLTLADNGNYTKALKYCRIVLNFMREDL